MSIAMRVSRYSYFPAPAAISIITCTIKSVILFALLPVDIRARGIINVLTLHPGLSMYGWCGKIIGKIIKGFGVDQNPSDSLY